VSRLRQDLNRTFLLLSWFILVVLFTSAGCMGPIKGTIALRDAQNLFNEASIETLKQYKNSVQSQDLEGLPPASPREKYQRVVEIIEGQVLGSVSRDDLKVNAQALAAFAHWRLGNFKQAKNTAEAGLDLYRRSGLVTNRRDYGMLLILRGLVTHSEAYRDYQAKRDEVAFLSPADAAHFTRSIQEALTKIDEINQEMDKNEPIVIYANQQQLRIIKNILDVWGSVRLKEDRKQEICDWSSRAETIYKTRFPDEDYPAKPHVDRLHQEIEELKALHEPCS
jgi:hypothetical protein